MLKRNVGKILSNFLIELSGLTAVRFLLLQQPSLFDLSSFKYFKTTCKNTRS